MYQAVVILLETLTADNMSRGSPRVVVAAMVTVSVLYFLIPKSGEKARVMTRVQARKPLVEISDCGFADWEGCWPKPLPPPVAVLPPPPPPPRRLTHGALQDSASVQARLPPPPGVRVASPPPPPPPVADTASPPLPTRLARADSPPPSGALEPGCDSDGECSVDALVRRHKQQNTVVVTFGNSRQRHFTENWVAHLQELGVGGLLVGMMNMQRTDVLYRKFATQLRAQGVGVYTVNSPQVKVQPQGGRWFHVIPLIRVLRGIQT